MDVNLLVEANNQEAVILVHLNVLNLLKLTFLCHI